MLTAAQNRAFFMNTLKVELRGFEPLTLFNRFG